DAPLLALSRDHEVLGVREHFFIAQDLPHLLCIVSCRRRQQPAAQPEPRVSQTVAQPAPARVQERSPDQPSRASSGPPADFDDGQRRLYDAIRRWRSDQAVLAGVPRYVVLTNREVEQIVRERPDSLAALRRIPGIGEAKINRHGESLLEVLAPAPRLVETELANEATP
ncbi:MAG: HRDC domain-containing protein, partial [Myxococcales bacterium]|nr:HRDC domain-containing protein [Myxococcales bacterium]